METVIRLLLAAGLIVVVPGCRAPSAPSGARASASDNVFAARPGDIAWASVEGLRRDFGTLVVDRLGLRISAQTRSKLGNMAGARHTANGYRQALSTMLGPSYPILRAPGDDTLRVSAVLTDRLTVPQLLVHRKALRASADGKLPALALEVSFHDAGSGELVGAILDMQNSFQYRASLANARASSEAWRVFRPLALRIKVALDRIRARSSR